MQIRALAEGNPNGAGGKDISPIQVKGCDERLLEFFGQGDRLLLTVHLVAENGKLIFPNPRQQILGLQTGLKLSGGANQQLISQTVA